VLEFPLPISSPFTSFLPASYSCIFVYSLPLEVSIRKLKLSSSIVAVLQASQTAVVFYHLSSSIVSCTSGLLRLQLSSANFQVQLLAVLQNFSFYNCLLPIFKFDCNCTSGLLRLQYFSYYFIQFQRFFSFTCLSISNYLAWAIHFQQRI
jgi:hypothetical protein